MEAHAKRKRLESPDEASAARLIKPTQRQPEADTSKRARLSAGQSVAQRITIHCVRCSRTRKYHESHPSRSYYLDTPAMVTSDHQARALHGQTRLRSLDNYLEECIGFSIVIFIDYDCEAYHNDIKDAFTRTPIPSMPEDINIDMKPYFRVLQQDGPTANAISERLHLSKNLEEALHTLQDQNADTIDELDLDEDLDHPYQKLYQFKHVFSGSLARGLEPRQEMALKVLSDYITERLALDYEELAQLSATGLVSQKHWLMLFHRDETVVTIRDGQYRAFNVKSCRPLDQYTLEMECWFWEYNGDFFRKHTTIPIKWPSKAKQMDIKGLSVYPVRYAEDGVQASLRVRGHTFWSCRRRKYVNYHVPLQGLASQPVRSRYARERALLTRLD